MKHVALLGLLSLAVPSAGLLAQSKDALLQGALDSINQVLHEHPVSNPAVNWERQRLDVVGDQLVLTISTQGLDGSIQSVRWTARASDLERAVGSAGQVAFPCRDNTYCAQLWEGLEEGHPLSSRSTALTLDISNASDLAAQLLSACLQVGDLARGIASSTTLDPAKRPN